MGQPKGGGYTKKSNFTPGQESLLNQITQNAGQYTNQAAEGYRQFLPGGGGGQPIIDQAMQRYQQQTLPSIMNAFGSGAKTSSALNQALGASAANLNTDLAAQLSQMQLSAAQGLGNLGLGSQSQGLGAQPFSHLQTAPPFWQDMILALLGAGGGAARGYLGGGR